MQRRTSRRLSVLKLEEYKEYKKMHIIDEKDEIIEYNEEIKEIDSSNSEISQPKIVDGENSPNKIDEVRIGLKSKYKQEITI